MAGTEAGKEAIWIRRLYSEICMSAIIRVDNQSAVRLAKNQIHHECTKHIDIRHHFIRECVDMGRIELEYIKAEDNTTDVLTKA